MTEAFAESRLAVVVEDDPVLRKLAAVVLEDAEFEVIQTASAEEALAFLRARGDQVRLLFTDVRLPGHISGIKLAHTVSVMWPGVKLLLTSGTSPSLADYLPETATFLMKPWRTWQVAAEAQKSIAA